MLIIGICGASGSGKSTLASELAKAIGDSCFIISQDAYYFDFPHLSFEKRANLNYDKPSIFDHDLLLKDIETMSSGLPIEKKSYDYLLHKRVNCDVFIAPPDLLIIEGIHSFYDSRLLNKMYLKLFVDVEPDICLLRRTKRDILERGRDIKNISDQYINSVKPMYDKYIKNYINYADIIVAGGGKNARIVDVLSTYLKSSIG